MKKLCTTISTFVYLSTGTAFAARNAEAPSVYINATGAYSVYKSELVQSNDTAITTGFGLGVYAGNDRDVGMYLSQEQTTVPFALNGATIGVAWQDVHIRYRWEVLYFGAVLASSKWTIMAPPDADADGNLDIDADAIEILNASTAAYGGNFGAAIPISKKNMISLDVTYVPSGTIQETLPLADDGTLAVDPERIVAIGPRTDIDLGASLDMSRGWLFWTIGFKMRTYQLEVDGVAYAEQLNSTYSGLKFAWDF